MIRDYLKRLDLTGKQEKMLKANIFLVKMLAVGFVFHVILWIYPDTSDIQAFYAQFITLLMNGFGYGFEAVGVYVLPGYEITQDCLGWKSMMAFTALVVSSTSEYLRNVKYVFGGLVLVAVANTLRVITTIHFSEAGLISFEIIHGFLWKWSLTFVVFASWILWFKKYRTQ